MRSRFNFLADLPRQKHLRLPVAHFPSYLVAFALILLGFSVYQERLLFQKNQAIVVLGQKITQANEQILSLTQAINSANSAKTLDRLKALEHELSWKKKLIQTLSSHKASEVQASLLQDLFEIARQTPRDVWLTHFQIFQDRSEIVLQGQSLSELQTQKFVRQLKTAGAFAHAQVNLFLQEGFLPKAGLSVRAFRVEIHDA